MVEPASNSWFSDSWVFSTYVVIVRAARFSAYSSILKQIMTSPFELMTCSIAEWFSL